MPHRKARRRLPWVAAGLAVLAAVGVSVVLRSQIDGTGVGAGAIARGSNEPSVSAPSTAALSGDAAAPSDSADPGHTPLDATNSPSSSPSGGPTATPSPAQDPSAADLGPDCVAREDALDHARGLVAGRLTLSRHQEVKLPRNPSWSEDPLKDRNWRFQYHTLRFTWDTFEAWRQTGDVEYSDRALFLLRDWVRDNPRGRGQSDFSWNDHTTAWRTVVLACAAVVRPNAAWVREALRVHGATLADPRKGRRPWPTSRRRSS